MIKIPEGYGMAVTADGSIETWNTISSIDIQVTIINTSIQ